MTGRDGQNPVLQSEGPSPAVCPPGGTGPADPIGRKLLIAIIILPLAAIGVLAVCCLIGPYQLDLTKDIFVLRLVRLASAATVGAALAASGVALQGLLRNPLADPYILGVSSGAGVGVLLCPLLIGKAGVIWLNMPACAMAGAVLAAAAVYMVSQNRGRLDNYSLILSGVIINSFNGALMLGLLLFLDQYQLAYFFRWATGEISDATDKTLLAACGAAALAGWCGLFLRSSRLNALGLGDEVASTLGVPVGRLRLEMFILVSITTGCAVALAGPIGFVGLIVPHICRLIVGPDHRLLMIVSGFAGAMLLMLADTVCRTAGPKLGVGLIPVGIITALCGGPFFIFLLRRRLREDSQ
ncbi:MAG: iron ABC transporter permease [Planctomycetes bacterium]|nr:iron ABC transporter permease [Planctomycetota bacterium]